MNSKRLLALILALFGSAFLINNVFALSYNQTEWGGRDLSYYSDSNTGVHRTLSGASWYYYEIPSGNTYADDEKLYVPFSDNSDEVYTDKVAIPAKTCQGYGGFWVLMSNGYTKDANSDSKGEVANYPVSAVRLSDIYYHNSTNSSLDIDGTTNHIAYKDQSGKTPDNTGSDDVKATKYGTMSDVYSAFKDLQGTTAVPNNATWDSDSSLSYFCAGTKKPEKGHFDSFSTVAVNDDNYSAPVLNGQGYLSRSLVVASGSTITITFRHFIAKSVEDTIKGNMALSYSLTGDISRSGSIPANELSERIRIGSTDYYASYTEEKITVPANSEQTYCSQATFNNLPQYSLSNFELISSTDRRTSGACVTVKPIAVSPDRVSNCDQRGDGELVVNSAALGNTAATVGISKNGNLEASSISSAAGADDTVKVYTKPGDVVQFSYAICFGAYTVKRGGSYIARAVTSNEKGNVIWNNFEVYSGIAGSPDAEIPAYMQNNEEIDADIDVDDETSSNTASPVSDLFGQKIYLLQSAVRETGKITYKSFLKGGDLNSPVNEATINYLTIDNNRHQIAFASPSSPLGSSASVTNATTQVIPGATMSQTLEYTRTSLWPNYLCKDSGGTDCVGPLAPLGTLCSAGVYCPTDYSYYSRAYAAYKAGYTKAYYGGKLASALGYSTNEDTVDKTASAVTPFNFDTNVTSEINNHPSDTVQPGDQISISANIDILPRVNPLTSDKNDDGDLVPYATATHPNTKVELIELIVRDTVDINDSTELVYNDGETEHKATIQNLLNGETDIFMKGSICNMYKGYLGDSLGECATETLKGISANIKDESLKVVGNANSNPEGEMGYYHAEGGELTRVVPDVEAGYKYCVAIGINHGDSHLNPGGELFTADELKAKGVGEKDLNTDPSFAANVYSVSSSISPSVKLGWKVSKASCRTVTKEPSFQVLNGGVYSSGDIEASVTSSTVNTKTTSNHPRTDTEDKKERKKQATESSYFGSWAQYYVVAKGSVKGFASASAFGYNTPYNYTVEGLEGLDQTGYYASKGYGSQTLLPGACDLARLTIANTNCNDGNVGGNYASRNADESALVSYKNRIINLYTNDLTTGDGTVAGNGTQSEIDKRTKDGSFHYADQNDADYLKVFGNYTIDTPIVRSFNSKPLVIEVKGHLFIDRNICLGNGLCQDSSYSGWDSDYDWDANNLSLTARNLDTLSSSDLENLSQIIIIAEDISISSEVSQIDAWLITASDDDGYDGGYINTCREFKNGSTDTGTCWKTLKFNGPVITSALILNRTGGSWPGFSGDVGNPAYETLANNMQTYINERVNPATEKYGTFVSQNPSYEATDYNAAVLFGNTASQLCGGDATCTANLLSMYNSAEGICRRNVNKASCFKKRLTILVKEDFLSSLTTDAERKAYKYALNFSANSESVSVDNFITRDLTCDGSSTPAEIFDLHPYVYLWAYGQSLKSHQAIVTYSQELSPRY